MMRYATLFTLVLLAACGGDGGTDPGTPEVSGLIITGGNFQSDTILRQLPNPLAVQAVRSGGQPAENVLICWVSVTEGAGEPFVPCANTDVNGEVETPWTLGRIARPDHVAEGRAIVDGVPTVVATYRLEALPGPADEIRLSPSSIGLVVGESFALDELDVDAVDDLGNQLTAADVRWTAGPGIDLRNDSVASLASLRSWVAPDAETFADTLEVLGVEPIDAAGLTAEWTCRSQSGGTINLRIQTEDGNVLEPADSMRNTLVLDSAVYISEDAQGTSRRSGTSIQVDFHGTYAFTIWWSDGQVQTNDIGSPKQLTFRGGEQLGPWPDELRRAWQGPDTLNVRTQHILNDTNQRSQWTIVRTAPRRWEGHAVHWCPDGTRNANQNEAPITIAEAEA